MATTTQKQTMISIKTPDGISMSFPSDNSMSMGLLQALGGAGNSGGVDVPKISYSGLPDMPTGGFEGARAYGNIVATKVPEEMRNQYGNYYATNMPSNVGLLSKMGVSEEASKQILPQPQAQPQQGVKRSKEDVINFVTQRAAQITDPVTRANFLKEADGRIKTLFPEKKSYVAETPEQVVDLERRKEEAKKSADAEVKLTQSFQKNRDTLSALNRQWDLVSATIDDAIAKTSETTAGWGALLKDVPKTRAMELSGLIDTIRANIGFDKLQQMRQDSPTGGALGQVSDFENKLLQAVKGTINQKFAPSYLQKVLGEIKKDLLDMRKERNRAFEKDYGDLIKKESAPTAGNTRIRVKQKNTGKTGSIDEGEFDANLYERL